MNNKLNSRVVKAISVAAVAAVIFISNPLASLANGGKNDKAKLNDEQVTVQYVGANDQHVVFHVDFQNPTNEKFWLIIRNDAGDVVYRKQFSDAHFSKSIYFENDQTEIRPTFIIRNSANEIVRQFAVTRTITEQTVVTKL
ncbi:hypothetical protein Q4E93_30365 [Flavitalea sp. BT771]|uniref:hypothetical protein n=1 Tax=Flavitalea sp. BT771 TaxID=3063329 RepID=UPI0026E4514D|nr:hypothetical protein [Flavitalea sp. BT771]MDO6434957.1 hypothetical protein [Flavitalea sp. BT771]MDV6223857.1 hypothetical protein [Flavitalea sp. BT771]